VSTGLALALALSYTKILGVEKRSVLTFVMVSAIILAFIFTSGISLALRNKPSIKIKDEEYFGFLAIVFITGLLTAIINCSLLLLYSNIKTYIPGPIYLVCFLYSFFACVALGYQDALIAMGNLKFATMLDLITVVIQAFTMWFFIKVGLTSLIISIFLAFILSYMLVALSVVIVVFNSFHFSLESLASGMRSILSQSRAQHLFGIANGLVDRVDRFLVGLLLPFGFIAKYALLSSIISVARFFPDAFIKLSLLRHHDGEAKKESSINPLTVFMILFIGLSLVFAAQFFIGTVFGKIWLLPISVGFLFLSQEILRGVYQIKAIRLIAVGGKSDMSRISVQLIVLSTLFISLGALGFGIWGVPAAMVLTYIVLILQIDTRLKRYSHVH
jgi:O-antigen/teichoic acid export membrane protein